MSNLKTADHLLSDDQLRDVQSQAIRVLGSLIKSHGIYASSSGVWDGQFHHYFGRDSAITALFIYEAEKIIGSYQLSEKALRALIFFAHYQGQRDDPVTGEEYGKIPHEINTSKIQIQRMQQQANAEHKIWFVDPSDGYLKNWDSVDATPLWLVSIAKFVEDGWTVPAGLYRNIAEATRWCLKNINNFGGYMGWVPAEDQPDRLYGGLTNQAWKDSQTAFEYNGGYRPVYPIYDIFSNAATWSALNYSAQLLYRYDAKLAGEAKRASIGLRLRFNQSKLGFRIKGKGFFAEALDGKIQKLTTPSIDVGMAMAMLYKDKSIIYKRYQNSIVNKLMSEEFFDESLGIRTYTQHILSYAYEDQYHRGPQTFWPFTGAIVAMGFDKLDFKKPAIDILNSVLLGLSDFDSFVELYQLKDNKATLWRSTASAQISSLNQAWTAGAAYFAASYLLQSNQPSHQLMTKIIRKIKTIR